MKEGREKEQINSRLVGQVFQAEKIAQSEREWLSKLHPETGGRVQYYRLFTLRPFGKLATRRHLSANLSLSRKRTETTEQEVEVKIEEPS